MYMIYFILHDAAHLDDVLEAWQAVGVTGVTLMESTGAFRRQQVGRDCRDHAELQRTRQHLIGMLRIFDQRAHIAQNTGSALSNLAPLLGELHARTRPLDEIEPQVLLQFADLHRQRRLRHRTGFRRPAEVLQPRQRIEVLELFQSYVCQGLPLKP